MIRAIDDPKALTIGVAGPATMVESPAVQASASEQIARGVRALRVDLRDCTAIDSTFSGTLLALKRQLGALGGELTLVSPSPTVCELLVQMGLDDFYDVELCERAAGPWREVSAPASSRDTLRRVVLDAHDELSRAPGAAGQNFRAVADELRRSDSQLPSSRDA